MDAYNASITGQKYDPVEANKPENAWKNPWDPSKNYELGDLIGGAMYRLSGTKAQNDYNTAMYERQTSDNARFAAEQRAWEERMSNSTYQRTVEDMKKAGINPALLSGLSSGSAVSTGSGSAATAGNASSSSGTSNGIIGALALVIAALSKGKVRLK